MLQRRAKLGDRGVAALGEWSSGSLFVHTGPTCEHHLGGSWGTARPELNCTGGLAQGLSNV